MHAAATGADERYRRSPALVCYWVGPRPVVFHCVTGQRLALSGEAMSLLSRLPHWMSAGELAAGDPAAPPLNELEARLRELADHALLERQSQAADEWPWQPWPEAAFFHAATRDHTYLRQTLDHDARLRRKARTQPPPPPTASWPGARTPLASAPVRGTLVDALQSRRTWRVFGDRPVPRRQLAALLQLTFGVRAWKDVPGQGRVALKTSPSGGARHSIEAYLIATKVAGLDSGVYHYDAATHELVHRRPAVAPGVLRTTLANQDYFMPAGAFIIMTAVFARAMWRYEFSRAYRTVLAEVGHLGQTFCLTATALRLAPFCTMAFRDRALEQLLGVDEARESALYVVGVGTRPRGRTAQPGRIPPRFRRRPRD